MTNTVLIFLVVPAAIIAVITGLTMAAGSGRRAKRYRPGRPYTFTPIWFLSSPDEAMSPDPVMQPAGSSAVAGRGHDRAVGSGESTPRALQAGASGANRSGVAVAGAAAAPGETGGASDRW